MGAQQTNNMSSSSLLSMVMLVAILHASSAFPTSVDDDNLVYAEWLKQESSKQGDSRSSEANQGSQFSIRAHRRSGAGSGSGSGSGTPPPTPPLAAPTPPPTAAATTVASSTVDTTSTTTKTLHRPSRLLSMVTRPPLTPIQHRRNPHVVESEY